MQLNRRQFVKFAGLSSVAAAGLSLAACGGSSEPAASGSAAGTDAAASGSVSGTITAVGSTALQPLVEAAAEQFMSENPDVQITVQGGGSGQGITQIAQGAVQIGNSDVFAEEKLDNPDDAKNLTDNKVAVVGMNWKDCGGDDEEIVVINRASGSGTRATFESAVLGGDPVPEDFKPQEQDSSGTVAKMVAETPGAISYLAFSYFTDDFKALTVDGVEPKEENVESNDWTIWAYEHMYTAADPDDATQAFIDYMLGDEVQGSLVEQNGYIPVGGMKVARDAEGNVTNL